MSTYQHARVLYHTGPLTTESVPPLILQLLTLDDDTGEAAHLYLTSPGGDALATLALIDVMRHVAVPVHTYAVGLCASAALFVLAAGERGHRHALPSAWCMFHGGVASLEGRVSELEARACHHRRVSETLLRLLSEMTGKPLAYWRRKAAGETWISASAAVEAGLIDQVLQPRAVA